jgi:NADPH-dependent 2,4-dienoyl-CoA reductase/sulfur reductase-like enzyme
MTYDTAFGPTVHPVSRRAVVLGGGGIGSLTAAWLGAQGTRVTVLEPGGEIASDVLPRLRAPLQDMLAKHGVEVRLKCTLESVRGGLAHVATSGQMGEIPEIDTVVVALRREPNEELAFQLRGMAGLPRIHSVGDAVLPRSIPDAVREGYLIGAQL